METHTHFWVLMEDKTDRPMLQLDDGRMAYTDRWKKKMEKLCPQLIREDNHGNKLHCSIRSKDFNAPENNIIDVKPVVCAHKQIQVESRGKSTIRYNCRHNFSKRNHDRRVNGRAVLGQKATHRCLDRATRKNLSFIDRNNPSSVSYSLQLHRSVLAKNNKVDGWRWYWWYQR